MQKGNQLKSCCKNSLSSREVVARDLPHPIPLFNEKKQSCFTEEVEDPGQKISGMTPNLMGFTLIELLVVVLIIGILAAVALPQYQKAVWKSRNTQLKTVAATVNQAQQSYRLANGSFTRHFQELSIDLPLASSSGSACGMSAESDSGRYTSNFEVQLYAGSLPIIVLYTSGPYKCAGFAYDKDGNMWCVERDGGTHFPGTAGSFCAKVEKATFSDETTALYSNANSRFYTLP